MTLRTRFSLAAALFAVVVVVGFGSLAYVTFGLQIERQLEALLMADLARVAALLDRPSLGASFGDTTSGDVVLQFVTHDDRIVLWWGSALPLPRSDRPVTYERDGKTYLTAQAPWRAANGTIRLAHDVTAALHARSELNRALTTSGAVIVLVAALVALVAVRRMLRPLADLARQTRAMQAAAPGAIRYDGPRDEVQDLADGLNDMLAAIRQRREEEQGFLLEVAHELAAPLTLVHYHLDELRRLDPDDGRLRAAADAARELLRTSQDLLVVARGELERPVAYQILDLRTIVARVANEYPGVHIDDGPGADVAGDPERLMQVVRNVVRNAVQAAGATSGVRVTLRAGDDTQVVEIHDVGPGMPTETQQRVFERGYTRGAGAGVGLAVAKSLIERHGGTIMVGSSSSAGTTIELRLPSLASRLDMHERSDPVSLT